MSTREILPPPRAVVTAAYVMDGPNPGVLLELCPCCTAQLTLAERDCLCRAQCTYVACPWDDPANLNAIARKAGAGLGGS